jgi:hypothetical protein
LVCSRSDPELAAAAFNSAVADGLCTVADGLYSRPRTLLATQR